MIFEVEVTWDIHKAKWLQAASLENQFESFEHRAAVGSRHTNLVYITKGFYIQVQSSLHSPVYCLTILSIQEMEQVSSFNK